LRSSIALGHDAKQVPPVYARPFRQGHKSDFRDAHAIVEAAHKLRSSKDRRSAGSASPAPRAISLDQRAATVSPASPSSASSTISRVASLTSSSFAEAVQSRPAINAVSSSRVRCEAGILVIAPLPGSPKPVC
jgi:hypothetical protein